MTQCGLAQKYSAEYNYHYGKSSFNARRLSVLTSVFNFIFNMYQFQVVGSGEFRPN